MKLKEGDFVKLIDEIKISSRFNCFKLIIRPSNLTPLNLFLKNEFFLWAESIYEDRSFYYTGSEKYYEPIIDPKLTEFEDVP